MPRKTNAQWQEEINDIIKQRDFWCNKYNELLDQLTKGLEQTPAYQQMQIDLRNTQADRDMYKNLCDGLERQLMDLRQQSAEEQTEQHTEQGSPLLKNPRMGRPQIYGSELREEIRQRRGEGYSLRAIARCYNVSLATVHEICRDIPIPQKRKKADEP